MAFVLPRYQETRELKTLYKMLLEHFLKIDSIGLCVAIMSLRDFYLITSKEYMLLKYDLYDRKPAGKDIGDFWFQSKEERIKFLNSIIESL